MDETPEYQHDFIHKPAPDPVKTFLEIWKFRWHALSEKAKLLDESTKTNANETREHQKNNKKRWGFGFRKKRDEVSQESVSEVKECKIVDEDTKNRLKAEFLSKAKSSYEGMEDPNDITQMQKRAAETMIRQMSPRESEQETEIKSREEEEQLNFMDCIESYGAYCKYLNERENDGKAFDETSIETMMFCFSAFQHGWGSYQKTESTGFAFKVADFIRTNVLGGSGENNSMMQRAWFLFVLWMRVGYAHAISRPNRWNGQHHREHCMFHTSKALTLDEFVRDVQYEGLPDERRLSQHRENSENEDCVQEAFCIFISHRWQSPDHPDAKGKEKSLIMPTLKRTQMTLDFLIDPNDHEINSIVWESVDTKDTIHTLVSLFDSSEINWATAFFQYHYDCVMLWYDYYSIPQGEDDDSRALRQKCLGEIALLCAFMPVLSIPTRDYFSRGWCFFECLECQNGKTPRLKNPSDHHFAKVSSNLHFFVDGRVGSSTDLWMKERLLYFLGQFCTRMEMLSDPTAVLENMGLACTNGSDLEYLSDLVAWHAKNAELQPISGGYWAHPIRAAYWRFIEYLVDKEKTHGPSHVSKNVQSILEFCEEHIFRPMENKIREGISFTVSPTVHATVYTRYYHPGDGLRLLVERKDDWIPQFPALVDKLSRCFQTLGDCCWGCPPDKSVETFGPFDSPDCQRAVTELIRAAHNIPSALVDVQKMDPNNKIDSSLVHPTLENIGAKQNAFISIYSGGPRAME